MALGEDSFCSDAPPLPQMSWNTSKATYQLKLLAKVGCRCRGVGYCACP